MRFFGKKSTLNKATIENPLSDEEKSRIKGKGVYLCTKAGGMWYVATQLQELNKIDKSVNRILNTNKLNVSGLIDASKDTDKHLVSDKGRIKYIHDQILLEMIKYPQGPSIDLLKPVALND